MLSSRQDRMRHETTRPCEGAYFGHLRVDFTGVGQSAPTSILQKTSCLPPSRHTKGMSSVASAVQVSTTPVSLLFVVRPAIVHCSSH